jgi:acetylornithine deacetylase/succinyl-diaminopimelate desuccinylase-like protein
VKHVTNKPASPHLLCVQVLVVVLLEAVTALLAEGFTPRRTLMFAFGHDEELTGTKGAGGWLTQDPYFQVYLLVQ